MDVETMISEMTLEEKASLCSGEDFWHTKAVERMGIMPYIMCDGPNGVRMQEGKADHLGINTSIKAVCFPTSSAVASSFDRSLARHIGEVLGDECQAAGVSMLLGPGMNIKRSPLCGRNFEYYSEDPYLSGQMAAAYIKGLESKNVGACVKHFAANNQETRRLTGDSVVDERTLHEIYLSGFETAVKEGKPSGVMCSYNRINGTYAAENKELLTDVLKEDWHFEGFVVTDWGAVKDRVEGIKAGLDLEMPGGVSAKNNDKKIVQAVQDGELSMEQLDDTVRRLLNFYSRVVEKRNRDTVLDLERDYKEAVNAAKECAVLLKNDGQSLPLEEGKKVAFIGGFVEKPRIQGSGSSHVNSAKMPAIREFIEGKKNIAYAKGFSLEEDVIDEVLEKEAIALAKESEAAVVFAGLPNRYEAEGVDRDHLELPGNQNHLISEIAKLQKNIIVVLHNGSPVRLPWAEKVPAILEMHLAGDGSSEAAMELLFGKANPSGKLAETYPLHLEDNPSFLNFPGENGVTEYHEGIFVGYRYYDKKKMKVLFPFGHGLSYSGFTYSDLKITKDKIQDQESFEVSVTVTNTGKYAGKEVVQFYAAAKESRVRRPERELKDFEKIYLKPGESRTVTVQMTGSIFSYYEPKIHDWYTESGKYVISAGSSSRDIRVEAEILVEASRQLPVKVTRDTTVGELTAHPVLKGILEQVMQQKIEDEAEKMSGGDKEKAIEEMGEGSQEMGDRAMLEMSLGAIVTFGVMTDEQMDGLIAKFNDGLEKEGC